MCIMDSPFFVIAALEFCRRELRCLEASVVCEQCASCMLDADETSLQEERVLPQRLDVIM